MQSSKKSLVEQMPPQKRREQLELTPENRSNGIGPSQNNVDSFLQQIKPKKANNRADDKINKTYLASAEQNYNFPDIKTTTQVSAFLEMPTRQQMTV